MRTRGEVMLSKVLVLAALAAAVGGCSQLSSENKLLAPMGLTMEDPALYPSDKWLRQGKVSFANGDYGIAEQNFRKAVEVAPRDREAWIGLAASYDRLRRFDLADRAYEQANDLGPQDATMLNNIGYSMLLRGDLKQARRYFLKAYELDPGNPMIQNNIELLGESGKSIKRHAG